ncbi:hypothetical protein [Nocardia australiensis]|uniref:hypothetical protein n=1 Tax=Nocardia australiensis TaxID=2887191 RepID=UPI001D14478C|nr:hypothetical protein [Nocardia australiensis]
MATGVGLRIAENESTAAIVTDAGEPQFIVRESILHMSDDGDTVLGGPAPEDHSHSITGYVSRVGDPAGITVDDGEAYRAEDLVATALFCLINLAAEHLSGPAEFYATHPADWPAEHVQTLREALDYLGLRAVVLVDEGDLPGSDVDDPETAFAYDPETAFAYDAARAALAAVLSTPAGATPPDPGNAENSMVVTDVMPAVSALESQQPQAYSAAIPIGAAIVEQPPTEAVAAGAPEPAAEATEQRRRATPLLIAAAALIGLILGGFGVSMLLRDDTTTPVPPPRDAKSDQVTVSPTAPAPPVDFPTIPLTTPAPTIEPETTTVEPETTTPAPTTTTPETTTAAEPPTITPSTTTTRPTLTNPFRYNPPTPWRPAS